MQRGIVLFCTESSLTQSHKGFIFISEKSVGIRNQHTRSRVHMFVKEAVGFDPVMGNVFHFSYI